MTSAASILERAGSLPAISPVANTSWLVRLRWVAIGGQLATIAVVLLLFDIELRAAPLFALIGVTTVSNILFQWWHRESNGEERTDDAEEPPRALLLILALDLLTLTGLLYFSGGPHNPFTVFYFVNLALAAVVLPGYGSWALTGLAIACFSALTWLGYVPVPQLELVPLATNRSSLEIWRLGLVVAFATCAVVICYFITRVTAELRQREQELRVAEQKRAQSERLEALATLAAGAGHELASPLSTIAVIANDLARHLEGSNVASSVIEDVALIRSELAHCRSILDRMSGSAGQAAGEQVGTWRLDRIIQEVVDGLRRAENVRVEGLERVGARTLFVPLQGLAQALRGLVQNGLDASELGQIVVIDVDATPDEVIIRVRDQGKGMSPDESARAGQPFFTTKEPGQGMGLGLFLTRNVIERLGGTLRLDSTLGQGTTAEVRLPTRQKLGSSS